MKPSTANDLAVSYTQPVGRRYGFRVRSCIDARCSPTWSGASYVDVGRMRDDVDGNGFGDALVTTPGASPPSVYLCRGTPSGFVVTNRQVLTRSVTPSFGEQAIFSGDVDGDGYAGVVITAPGAPVNGQAEAGRIFVYRGGPNGLTGPWLELTGAGQAAARFWRVGNPAPQPRALYASKVD